MICRCRRTQQTQTRMWSASKSNSNAHDNAQSTQQSAVRTVRKRGHTTKHAFILLLPISSEQLARGSSRYPPSCYVQNWFQSTSSAPCRLVASCVLDLSSPYPLRQRAEKQRLTPSGFGSLTPAFPTVRSVPSMMRTIQSRRVGSFHATSNEYCFRCQSEASWRHNLACGTAHASIRVKCCCVCGSRIYTYNLFAHAVQCLAKLAQYILWHVMFVVVRSLLALAYGSCIAFRHACICDLSPRLDWH